MVFKLDFPPPNGTIFFGCLKLRKYVCISSDTITKRKKNLYLSGSLPILQDSR